MAEQTDVSARLDSAADRAEQAADILHAVAHGGPADEVPTNNGPTPSIKKWLADQEAQFTDQANSVLGPVTEQAERAETAAAQAGAAADAAAVAGHVFDSVDDGLNGTGNAEYFSVPSADDTESLILYRNTAGVAVPIKKYPASAKVELVGAQAVAAMGAAWARQRSSRVLLRDFDDDGGALQLDRDGNMVGGPLVIQQLANEAGQGVTAFKAMPRRALLGGFDDPQGGYAQDAGGNVVDGPLVVQRLASEAEQGVRAYRTAPKRALLGGFDDLQGGYAQDAGGNVVDGPFVIQRLAGEAEQGVRAYRTAPKRALLGGFDDLSQHAVVDRHGNLVGGPAVTGALLAGSPASVSDESRYPVYIDTAGVLKIIGAQGVETFADIAPNEFMHAAQWRGRAVITSIDRASLGAETPVAVAAMDDGALAVIPSSRNLLIVIPSYGQSNSVGAQSYEPPPAMTQSAWPDDLVMFDLASGAPDIRMGMPAGGAAIGAEELIDGNNLIGFTSLVSKQSAVQTNRGATVLEGVGFTVQKLATEYLGFRPRVLMFAPGYGSRPLRDLDKGTVPYENFRTALTRAKALADAQGLLMYVPFVIFVHGEGDSTNVNYYTDLPIFHADIQADIQAITGQQGTVPFCCSQASTFFSTEVNGVLDTYRLSKESPLFVLSAPYYPYEFAPDELHLGNRGLYLGEKMARTILRETKLWGAKGKGALKPISVTFDGVNTIDLLLDVPVGPLVRDTTNPHINNPPPADWGFEVHDGAGAAVTISSVTIISGTTIRIVTASTPTAGASRALRYAMTGYPGTQNGGGVRTKGLQPRGQVRDSESTPSIVDGTHLHSWLCHFSENF